MKVDIKELKYLFKLIPKVVLSKSYENDTDDFYIYNFSNYRTDVPDMIIVYSIYGANVVISKEGKMDTIISFLKEIGYINNTSSIVLIKEYLRFVDEINKKRPRNDKFKELSFSSDSDHFTLWLEGYHSVKIEKPEKNKEIEVINDSIEEILESEAIEELTLDEDSIGKDINISTNNELVLLNKFLFPQLKYQGYKLSVSDKYVAAESIFEEGKEKNIEVIYTLFRRATLAG